MGKYVIALCIAALPFIAQAQDKWDLRRCVEYAVKNNISVKQADVQARIADLQLKQQKYNQYPTANFSTNLGTQFGRSIDPTTNLFVNTQLLYQNLQLQGGITVFSFGQVKNAIEAARYNAQAMKIDVDRTANDISINVATYYLQVLASREQININEVQIGQTKSQLDDTRKRVDAGALPELNLAELEAQLATDSTNLITARTNFDLNVLQLKAVLNLDAAAPFEVDTPPVEKIPLESLMEMQPDAVYLVALGAQPLQKVNELKIKSQEANVKAYKYALYPTLSLGYSLGSQFSNSLKDGKTSLAGYEQTAAYTKVSRDTLLSPVYSTNYSQKRFTDWWYGYADQLNNNFQQSVGLTLSVPIFNGGNSRRITYERSKLDLQNMKLQKEQGDMTLKQNIYTAYTNAVGSMDKYNTSAKSVESAQKAYDYARKRYEVGLLSTIDLLTNQNKLLTAKLQQLSNRYDYVFRMKLLEFYKGQGLKL
ncbi:MAG: TolC family protein [Filimonas sp.]|nr:TolC family protein [Filimonas sp.]